MNRIDVEISMPSYLEASQNTDYIYATEITKKDPIPTIQQSYRYALSHGPTAFKVYFGMIHSIIRHKNKDIIVFVCALPGRGDGTYEDIKTRPDKIYTLKEIPFSRIRSDLDYGYKLGSGTAPERYDLDLMLTHYPRETAKSLFNADVLVAYPINLEGNVYEEKYTVCRAVAVNRDGLSFFMYFMMTNDNYKDFDSHLADFGKVFWFRENE